MSENESNQTTDMKMHLVSFGVSVAFFFFFFQFFIICFDLFNLWLCDKLTNRVAFTTVAVSIQLVKASVASFPTGAMKTSSLTSSSNQLFIKLATLMIIK